jgi:methyl-accepting chemotaxis protein
MKNLKLSVKLFSAIAFCVLGFVVFGAVSWNTIKTTKVNGAWYEKIVQGKDLIADILPPPEYIIEAYLLTYQMIDEKDQAKVNELLEKLKSVQKDYAERHEYWVKNLPEGPLKEELVKVSYQPAQKFFETLNSVVIPAVMSKDGAKARQAVIDVMNPLYEEHRKSIDKTVNMANEGLKKDEDTVRQILSNRTLLLSLLGVGIFVLMISSGFYLNIAITRPIKRVIASLTEGADQVASASSQVGSASQSLAQGSSEQAASLEETSASLEEMASMTRTNADNARQADALMGEASRVVDTANTSMTQLTASMQEVSAASQETAKIIKTIDEIAFQTNLLALNAAVEAARAGEAGAGFAVVADEVRALAMRAAEAAKNTATMIEGTVDKVKEGSSLVVKTAEAFSQVTGSTGKVKELVAEIAAASGEQAQGVDQINRAVTEMNNVTQQTAANAEESASAAQELTAQSIQMKGVVGELAALVGGRGNSSNGHHSRPSRPAAGLKTRLATMRQTLGRGKSQATSKALTPEQVIPLEDDNFKDF